MLVAAAALLSIALLGFHQRGIFGYEVNSNFFFGQIAGEAVFWCWAVSVLIWRDRSDSPGIDIWALAAFFFCQYAHLVPALRIAGVYGMLLLVDDQTIKHRWWRLAFFFIASLVLLWMHPSTQAMLYVSGNDGVLEFAIPTSPAALFALSAVLALVSAATCFANKDNSAARMLGYIGVSIAALLAAQTVAFEIGYGGFYSVKKHGYGAITLLIVNSALILGSPSIRVFKRDWSLAAAALLGLAMTAAVTAPAQVRTSDVESFAAFGREVGLYHASGNVPPIAFSTTAIGTINAMVSLGELSSSPAITIGLMGNKLPPEPGAVNLLIVDQADARFPHSCDLAAPVNTRWRLYKMNCSN